MVLLNVPDKSYKHQSIESIGGDVCAYRENHKRD